MGTLGKTIAAVTLAAAMLLIGGIGLLRSGDAEPASASVTSRDVRAETSLLPAAGDLASTIAALQDRIRRTPQDPRALTQLGIAYVTQARVTADPSWYPRADEALAEASRLAPEDPTTLLGQGILALARHDFEDALRLGERARRLAPYDADVYGVIGDALLELGRYDLAFDAFQTMVDTKPELASYARASYARELLGDVDGAVAAMRRAFDAAGAPADAAWAAHQLGELEFNRGDVPAARGWFERGLDLDAGYVPNAAGLAKVAWAEADVEAAIVAYEDVVARFPAVEYVAALRDLYETTGRDDLAEQQDAVIEASRQLQTANGVNPDLELALDAADRGDPSDALASARAEWERRESVHVADALAWALYANGEYEEAARYARRARSLGTRSATFLFHAGMIERALGHDERALRFLRDALAVNPHFSILHVQIAERVVAELEAGR